jgi:uncharacterized damage-inducible protein DinB
MSQIQILVDELRRAFYGEAWHGPALMEILDGIDAKTAAARPIPAAHNAWELVLHLTAWEGVIVQRLQGKKATVSDADNFPHISDSSEQTWQEAVANLRRTHEELIKTVSSLPESKLQEIVPGKDYDARFMLFGAVEHTAYHGGQIALLKRSRV